jgi:hypothetical protein
LIEIPSKLTKTAYLKTILLLFKSLTIVADQIIDIILVATLFIIQEYWFAVVYLAVDVFPAAVIMWQKFQTEKSWRVLVSIVYFLIQDSLFITLFQVNDKKACFLILQCL